MRRNFLATGRAAGVAAPFVSTKLTWAQGSSLERINIVGTQRKTQLVLTATASGSSAFAGWSGPCSGTGTCTVSVGAGDIAVTAMLVGTNALAVVKAGNGAGTVTSSPAGIDCGVDCTEQINHGTMVTLVATADASSNFAGWSGFSRAPRPGRWRGDRRRSAASPRRAWPDCQRFSSRRHCGR